MLVERAIESEKLILRILPRGTHMFSLSAQNSDWLKVYALNNFDPDLFIIELTTGVRNNVISRENNKTNL